MEQWACSIISAAAAAAATGKARRGTVVFLLEIDDLLYNAVIDARYKRYARRHRFRLRWFDYYLLCAPSVPDARCDGVLWKVP